MKHANDVAASIGITAAVFYLVATLTGCGISAGPVAIGTTGFLVEHNKGQKQRPAEPRENITASDRAEMNAFLDKQYSK